MKFRFKGLDEYVRKLERLSNLATVQAMIEKAVADGSVIVDDMTIAELRGLPTDDRPYRVDMRNGIRTIEKDFLIKEFGTSPIENKNWFINDKTGVDKGKLTYNGTRSEKNWREYTPAIVLARSLERGTSFMPRNPVFSRASRKARTPCLKEMERSLNESIEKISKG